MSAAVFFFLVATSLIMHYFGSYAYLFQSCKEAQISACPSTPKERAYVKWRKHGEAEYMEVKSSASGV